MATHESRIAKGLKGKKGRSKSKKVTMKPQKKGQEPVTFGKGGLHRSLGVPEDEKIPESKVRAAAAGRYGPKAKKQALMYLNMLKKGQKTAAK